MLNRTTAAGYSPWQLPARSKARLEHFTGGKRCLTSTNLTLDFSSGTTIDGNSVFSNLGNLTSKGQQHSMAPLTTGSQTYEDAVELVGDKPSEHRRHVAGGLDGSTNGQRFVISQMSTIDKQHGVLNLVNLQVLRLLN